MNSKLYVFVEGDDDVRLLRTILKKCFSEYIPKFLKYKNSNSEIVKGYIEKLICDKDYYVMFTDKDKFSTTLRKKHRVSTYGVEEEKVIVVDSTIESWYTAGAKKSIFDLGKKRSETIDKKKFDQLIGRRAYHSMVMEEICNNYDTSRAIQNSKSFKYFYRKLKKILGGTN